MKTSKFFFCETGRRRALIFQLELVNTLASTCIYDAYTKVFMFEPKRLRAVKLCMNHHLVDVYKFCTQDAPGLITGPVLGLRHLYIGICQPIVGKFLGNLTALTYIEVVSFIFFIFIWH